MEGLEQSFTAHCARIDIHATIKCYAGAGIPEDTWQIYLSYPGDRKYQEGINPLMGVHSGATLAEAMRIAVNFLETQP